MSQNFLKINVIYNLTDNKCVKIKTTYKYNDFILYNDM